MMRIKLINGPLHGLDFPIEEGYGSEFLDFLDNNNGMVRRYRRTESAFFVKEWSNKEIYDQEMKADNTARSGQLREDDAHNESNGS